MEVLIKFYNNNQNLSFIILNFFVLISFFDKVNITDGKNLIIQYVVYFIEVLDNVFPLFVTVLVCLATLAFVDNISKNKDKKYSKTGILIRCLLFLVFYLIMILFFSWVLVKFNIYNIKEFGLNFSMFSFISFIPFVAYFVTTEFKDNKYLVFNSIRLFLVIYRTLWLPVVFVILVLGYSIHGHPYWFNIIFIINSFISYIYLYVKDY